MVLVFLSFAPLKKMSQSLLKRMVFFKSEAERLTQELLTKFALYGRHCLNSAKSLRKLDKTYLLSYFEMLALKYEKEYAIKERRGKRNRFNQTNSVCKVLMINQ